jgi:hypothetical protein
VASEGTLNLRCTPVENIPSLPSPPDPVEDASTFGDCFGAVNKGKGDSCPKPATEANESQERPNTWHTEPSRQWRHPALPEEATSLKRTAAADEGYNDYPQIDGPRSSNRRSMVPYTPYPNLPDPQHISIHKPVTSYAGQALYALCPSVPYVLGPLALITQLQLIVETPILLPDEVIDLVEARGVNISTLGSYDLAMLNILGCLWND